MGMLFALSIICIPLLYFAWLFIKEIWYHLEPAVEEEIEAIEEEPAILQLQPSQIELPLADNAPMKRCPKCQRDLPITSFRRNSHTADGLTKWCAGCMAQPQNTPPHLKYCPRCNRNRRLSSFYKSARNQDGLTKWCKSCLKQYQVERKAK
jgi:hypothetical protein